VKRYILELHGILHLPEFFGDLLEIPVCDGQHYCDLDVLEDEMLHKDVKRLRQGVRERYLSKYGETPDKYDELPLGFYWDKIPLGARVIEVSDPSTIDMFSEVGL